MAARWSRKPRSDTRLHPFARGPIRPGQSTASEELIVGPDDVDGMWFVDVPIGDEAVMRVDIIPEVV